RRHIGDIRWRAEQDAVRSHHLVYTGIAHVAGLGTVPILVSRALAAGPAAMDVRARKLDEFGSNAFPREFPQGIAQQNRGVPALGETRGGRYNLHRRIRISVLG